MWHRKVSMVDHSNVEFQLLKRRVVDCFRYKAYVEGEAAAAAAHEMRPGDAFVNYYHAMNLFELKRREEALEKLRLAARLAPREIVAIASGHYLGRRLRTAEGYQNEDGWITMLEVALESNLLPSYQLESLVDARDLTGCPATALTIPRTIIQFWDTDVVPEEVRGLMEKTRAANPNYCHLLFSEEAARDYVRSSLGADCVPLFDVCPHAAAKADFFRAAYLMEHGGVYIDADEVSESSLSEHFDSSNFDLILVYTKASVSCINNWFIAAAPHSAIVERAVENIVENLRNVIKYGLSTNVWLLTGPGVWTFAAIDLALDPWSYNLGVPFKNACFLDERCYRKLFRSPPMQYKATAAGNWRL